MSARHAGRLLRERVCLSRNGHAWLISVDGNRLSGGGYTIYLDKRHSDSPIDDATVCITNELADPIYSGNAETGDFARGFMGKK